ncbi:hypothetical protein REH70_03640 [Cellulomonas sp. ATA003]|nr:hypothetical protein [Cellulomonas sp. ATA003]WNB86353.1 hypothetical protein REH70_03640 [Cellulomonas sp. ATA003]
MDTVARPHIMASITVYGRPSEMLERATIVEDWYAVVTGRTGPSKVTASPRASSSATRRTFAS